MTLVDTLALLRDALRARDKVKKQIGTLDDHEIPAGTDKKKPSQLAKLTAELGAADVQIGKLHAALAREIEASQTVIGGVEEELALLEERHESGKVTDANYARQVAALEKTKSAAGERIEIREKAQRAESATDLAWLATLPAAQRKADRTQQISENDISEARVPDWPGASVPERIQMLLREGRRSHSRGPIIISTIVVGAIAIIVLGLVIVSNLTSPRTAADYLEPGDVLIPVIVDDMQDVRNLDFTLQYDPQLLTAVSIVQDKVGRLSVMEYDIDPAGQLKVSVRDVTGITGSGAIVIIRFKANDAVEEQAELGFASVSATDVLTLEDRPAVGEDGWIDTVTLQSSPPVLRFPEQ